MNENKRAVDRVIEIVGEKPCYTTSDLAKGFDVSSSNILNILTIAIPEKMRPLKIVPEGTSKKAANCFKEKHINLIWYAMQRSKTRTRREVKEELEILGWDALKKEATVKEIDRETNSSARDLINIVQQGEELLVSSREVAENFGKEHKNVLRDIEGVIFDGSNLGSEFFIKSEYVNTRGKAYKEYLLTQDGFSLLVMGFTGSKAMQWKLKYISAFNKMRKQLENKASYSIEDPILRAKAWIEEQEKIKALQIENTKQTQVIKELRPRADYTDRILANKDLVTVTQIAKDYGMSGRKFNELLNKLKVQYRLSGQWLLYQDYSSEGYTHSETIEYVKYDGSAGVNMLTKWTQKGRLFLYDLLKENEILPSIEKE